MRHSDTLIGAHTHTQVHTGTHRYTQEETSTGMEWIELIEFLGGKCWCWPLVVLVVAGLEGD